MFSALNTNVTLFELNGSDSELGVCVILHLHIISAMTATMATHIDWYSIGSYVWFNLDTMEAINIDCIVSNKVK
jgi:hypothetical protein